MYGILVCDSFDLLNGMSFAVYEARLVPYATAYTTLPPHTPRDLLSNPSIFPTTRKHTSIVKDQHYSDSLNLIYKILLIAGSVPLPSQTPLSSIIAILFPYIQRPDRTRQPVAFLFCEMTIGLINNAGT